MLSHLVL